ADERHLAHPRTLEGAFYLWSLEEVESAVGPDLAPLVVARFGLRPGGNAHDPTGEFRGRNVLYTALDLEDVARETGRPLDEVIRGLRVARQRLFTARQERPAPSLDDKVVTAGNGLMIAACARAGRVLTGQGASPTEWLTLAERAAHFLRETLWDRDTNRLRRSWRAGQAGGARALPGHRRCRLARVGHRPSGPPRRGLLGRHGRRLVQHRGRRPVGAAAHEGGLRRSGALGQFRRRRQPADAGAPHQR